LVGIGEGRRPRIDDVLARYGDPSERARSQLGLAAIDLLGGKKSNVFDAIVVRSVHNARQSSEFAVVPCDHHSSTFK
jgi:hypothetical protein